MYLRDWFAGLAMSGMLANPQRANPDPDALAQEASLHADALIRLLQPQ